MKVMRVGYLLLLLLCPFIIKAQAIISGKVTRADTKAPVGRVSIFLSNSSFGTSSADDGAFTLSGIKPGQYQLVTTSLGFEEFTQTIMVGKEPIKLDITLSPKTTQLREVVITTNADWKKNYAIFEREFIGTSANSKKCRVINPHVVTLLYHGKKQTLEAWTDEFLVVENKALGYRVKYLLKNFTFEKLAGYIAWEGQVLFEELPGSESQKKEWKLKREECYYGSPQHFFRTLYQGTTSAEGFVLRRLIRTPNPDRPPDEVIYKKVKTFGQLNNRDSVNYWATIGNMPRYRETLIKAPIAPAQVFARLDKPGLFAIGFQNCLYLVYTKKHEETDFRDVYHPLDMENFETSVVTLFKNDYAIFDSNGTVISMPRPLFEGTWSKAKLAELLPLDYVPGQ